MTMSAFDLSQVSIGAVAVSSKGAKSLAFNSPGTPIAATLDPVEVCFEPSSYGDDGTATRVNIVFRPSEAIAADLEQLDAWLLRTAAENSLAWFGKQKTVQSLEESYTPILKHTKYGPQFKAKLNLAPPAQTRIWDQQKQVRGPPESWKGASVKPRLHLRGVYFMGAQFGAVVECTDVQILMEAASSCPF
jgi:hypothetical protein